MIELGVIADDLTGGMMVASLLEREGVRCPLVTSTEVLKNLQFDAEAVVIGRKIRLIPPTAAVADAKTLRRDLLPPEPREFITNTVRPLIQQTRAISAQSRKR